MLRTSNNRNDDDDDDWDRAKYDVQHKNSAHSSIGGKPRPHPLAQPFRITGVNGNDYGGGAVCGAASKSTAAQAEYAEADTGDYGAPAAVTIGDVRDGKSTRHLRTY